MSPKRRDTVDSAENTTANATKKRKMSANTTPMDGVGVPNPVAQPKRTKKAKATACATKSTSESSGPAHITVPSTLGVGTANLGHCNNTSASQSTTTATGSLHGNQQPVKKVAGRRRRKRAAGSRSPTPTNYGSLADTATDAMKANGKSAPTITRYKQLLSHFRTFLKSYEKKEVETEKERCQKQRSANEPDDEAYAAPGDDPTDSADAPTTMDPDFPYALDGPPKAITPFAIALFIYERCGPGKNSMSEAWQIHSAVAWHYDEMDGDRYRNWWTWDSASQTWVGNPARSARVKSMLATVKNIHAQDNRNHSRATTVGDMQAMHSNRAKRLKELEGLSDLQSRRERAELLLFGALSTIAWLVWLRCNEVVHLTLGDLLLFPPEKLRSDGSSFVYLILSVCKRKNWTRKDEAELTGHIYHLFQRKDQPAIDAYTHLQEWLSEYREILGRPLQENDVLFPTINASMRADATQSINEDYFRKLVRTHATNAGLHHAEGFKTHCFRRGGAQYRFMYAPLDQRWTLARIRWWGGWAKSETGDTLIKYLLDELFTYEEDHRNALQPDEDGRTTDLKGLEERKGLQGSGGADGSVPPTQESISEAVAQAVRDVLKNEFSTRQSYGFSTREISHYLPTDMETDPNSRRTPSGALTNKGRTHPQPAFPDRLPQACGAAVEWQAIVHPIHPLSTVPSYNFSQHPFNHLPHDASANTMPRSVLHGDAHSWPTAARAPQPFALPHSQVAFAVAPQPTVDTHAPRDHIHYWDSRHHNPPSSSSAAPAYSPPSSHNASSSIHGHLVVPKIGRSTKPEVIACLWKQAVDDWDGKDPRRCPVPLRDWEEHWYRGTRQAVIYHQRKVIALEFIEGCNRNEDTFRERYPEHAKGINALVVAITAARTARGDARKRTGKNTS